MNSRTKYSIPFKLMVCEQFKRNGSKSLTARAFGITHKMVRSWYGARFDLEQIARRRFRYRRSSTRVPNVELERDLVAEIVELRGKGTCVDGNLIIARARLIAARLGLTSFNGSRGWLYGFLLSKLIIHV